jgi:hypothetical protein
MNLGRRPTRSKTPVAFIRVSGRKIFICVWNKILLLILQKKAILF